ncbi:tRNA pseudouridine(55) synthase TruB [Garciella nitratireducens]|uniref:tRNA pseudouridine synthase B n=1 Tax=Garciella nitratireducens DSM 15102 TaxID=1121911 RepID=A0A1T4JWD3_9FIRM|nr:tRNA pseudouridine(55) synthase TruB [Garciella nitratireducens]SJZ34486.1 tRNA pseudouridine55 synthase [Garciella nitratireducens DSM 15102]
MDGILNVLKPPGMTSHDVVQWIKTILEEKKVGHSGTLDPGAAGVLPVFIGKATKIIPYIYQDRKIYRVEIIFGKTTDTQDRFGKVIKECTPYFSLNDLEYSLNVFTGAIEQKPPIYSAIKINGKKLYEYARKGQNIEIPKREVVIHNIELVHHDLPYNAYLNIECSRGTYIRSLCRDIGEFLGCGAYMGFLLRISSGIFSISSSYTLEEIEFKYKNRSIKDILLPIDFPLKNYSKIEIKESAKKSLENGNPIYPQGIISDMKKYHKGTFVIIYCNEQLLALGEILYDKEKERCYIKPFRVLK